MGGQTYDFGKLNEKQIEAATVPNGTPCLVIAGPGTGKTATLIERAVYLMVHGDENGPVKPEEMFIATFTRKAANEVLVRLSEAAGKAGLDADLNEMYIGTFHEICGKIIREFDIDTGFGKNPEIMEPAFLRYCISENLDTMFHSNEEGYKKVISAVNKGGYAVDQWAQAGQLKSFIEIFEYYGVSEETLKGSKAPFSKELSGLYHNYKELLRHYGGIDYGSLVTSVAGRDDVLDALSEKIRYILIDEYQDTDSIQNEIIFHIASKHKNLWVVGDDDQSLYRFRGATVENILGFNEECKKHGLGNSQKVELSVNYRSEADIVRRYTDWLNNVAVDWKGLRYKKSLTACKEKSNKRAAAGRIGGSFKEETWQENIYQFVKRLKDNGTISDYNQIAFLFHSVGNSHIQGLVRYLEERGLPVYSPRAKMFFEHPAIMALLGCLVRIYGEGSDKLIAEPSNWLLQKVAEGASKTPFKYHINDCLKLAEKLPDDVRRVVSDYSQRLEKAGQSFPLGIDIFYELLSTGHFNSLIDIDYSAVDAIEGTSARDLGLFQRMILNYESIHGIKGYIVGDKEKSRNPKLQLGYFIAEYLKHFYDNGVDEPEDPEQHFPKGHLIFMTIHQSKGLEFPVVISGLPLSIRPEKERNKAEDAIRHITGKSIKEDLNLEAEYDVLRVYFTSFSRAKDLLVLTHYQKPIADFLPLWNDLPDAKDLDIAGCKVSEMKEPVNNPRFSYTTDYRLYKQCPRKYLMIRFLNFAGRKSAGQIFGSTVHQTLEEINKKWIASEEAEINENFIDLNLSTNLESLEKSAGLTIENRDEAKLRMKNAVMAYAKAISELPGRIAGSEENVKLVEKPLDPEVEEARPDYIINGNIDMRVEMSDSSVVLYDFKTDTYNEKEKPSEEEMKGYEDQLRFYANLIEKTSRKHISGAYLYFTQAPEEMRLYPVSCEKSDLDRVYQDFRETIKKIRDRDFSSTAEDPAVCSRCEFRIYCGK